MNLRVVAVVIAAIGVLVLGAALLQPRDEPTPPPGARDGFVISATTSDGVKHTASVECEGDIVGTGYLAKPADAFKACTFDDTVSVHRFLQAGPSACDLLIADADNPGLIEPKTSGTALIKGIYFDEKISRRVEDDECGHAAWKLLAPLLPQ